MIFERIRGHLRFAQIGFAEIVEVDDQNSIRLQVRDIGFQRGGIHGDKRVHVVAGRVHIVRREMDLKSADARQRSGRGANFGREIGQRREIVAVKRDGIGELASGDLHAVAGVAAKTDHSFFDYFALAPRDINCCGGHGILGSP